MTDHEAVVQDPEAELLTIKKLADRTGVSTRTIYEMIRKHEVPIVRFGSRILLDWSDVVEARKGYWPAR